MHKKFFLNGEYAILRTRPATPQLYVESCAFNFLKIKRRYENVDMGADYESFVLRQYFHGKFYKVNNDGSRGEVSPIKNWKVDEFYLNLHHFCSNNSGILNCKCSYPYFTSLICNPDDSLSLEQRAASNSADYAGSQPLTCLIEDNGREVNYCPNCNRRIDWRSEQRGEAIKAPSKDGDRQDNEFVVVQTYPCVIPLIIVHRSHDYKKAHSAMLLENMSEDNKCFVMRIYFDKKFYLVTFSGKRGALAPEQNWEIEERYLEVAQREGNDAEILRCDCSYPYFTLLASESSSGTTWAESQPVTCLVEDNGREIDDCPNCGRELFSPEDEEEEVEEVFDTPTACLGCKNYHGYSYNGNRLICALHPNGWDDDNCPDYTT